MSLKKINGYTLNLNKELGRGNFGVVYQAEQDGTRIPCAIKMLDKMHKVDSDDYIRSAIFREIQILKNLKCDHIVGFFDVMQSSRYYYIVQELCDTDLERLMKKKDKFKQAEAIEYLTQICDGFLCLIRQGIVHRDLKPANIMLRNNNIKLGDFGLAKRCRNKRIKIDSSVGSPLYMSLQLLKQQPYSSKCDIWAVGCVFYQMLHGKTPWHARTEYALVTAIETQPLKIDESLSQKTRDFLRQCLQKRECDRISWDDLFIHPIFESRFRKYSKRNNQFENKLKMIMSDIRFRINMQNIDLRKLILQMGFDDRTQLMFKNFDEFIRVVNPSITSQEVVYFFEKLDVNDDGRVSVKELEVEMLRNHIPIDVNIINGKQNIIQKQISSFQQLPSNNMLTTTTTTSIPFETSCMSFTQHKKSRITQQLEYKIRRSFIKLYKILNDKKLTLYKTFKSYDENKSNRLEMNQFSKILTKLDNSFTEQQINVIFTHVDKDESGSIEFDQFNAYYCGVNGVPEMIDLPPEYYYAKGKVNFRSELNGNNNSNTGWKTYFKDIDTNSK